jgi:hypothetical protein
MAMAGVADSEEPSTTRRSVRLFSEKLHSMFRRGRQLKRASTRNAPGNPQASSRDRARAVRSTATCAEVVLRAQTSLVSHLRGSGPSRTTAPPRQGQPGILYVGVRRQRQPGGPMPRIRRRKERPRPRLPVGMGG